MDNFYLIFYLKLKHLIKNSFSFLTYLSLLTYQNFMLIQNLIKKNRGKITLFRNLNIKSSFFFFLIISNLIEYFKFKFSSLICIISIFFLLINSNNLDFIFMPLMFYYLFSSIFIYYLLNIYPIFQLIILNFLNLYSIFIGIYSFIFKLL